VLRIVASRHLVMALVVMAVALNWPLSNADDGEMDSPTEAGGVTSIVERGIDLDSDAANDDDIRRRLNGIYDELDLLEPIGVSVANGIVTLTGTVSSSQANDRATEIASQVDGVVDVVDELVIDTRVSRRIESTLDRLQGMIRSLVATLPVLLLALVVTVAFWFFGRWIGRRRAVFDVLAPNTFIADLLSLLARIAIVLAGVVLALTLLDATAIIGSVLGAAGIFGLALGFAVRDTVENFIASILLSLRTPFVARDYVCIGEHEGTVARLTSRATILISRDGNHVRVPNAQVYKAVIVNYTRQPERQFEFDIGVDTDLDLNAAQRTAVATIYGVSGVLTDPPATVLVSELGESNVSLTVRAWIDQGRSDLLKVRSEAIRQVKQAFDEAGIAMPEPIYRVRFQDGHMNTVPVDSISHTREVASAVDDSRQGDPKSIPVVTGSSGNAEEGRGAPSAIAAEESGLESVCDTSANEVMQRSVERELSDTDSENLLHGTTRTE